MLPSVVLYGNSAKTAAVRSLPWCPIVARMAPIGSKFGSKGGCCVPPRISQKNSPAPSHQGRRDAAYCFRCSARLIEDRELRAQWQRACELLLAKADVAAFSKQVELALFYDAKLDVVRMQRAIDN